MPLPISLSLYLLVDPPQSTLEVYTKVMERKRDTGARMDALIRGADWALAGTSGSEANGALPVEETNGGRIPLR
jgi:hypothetical protein